MKLVLRLVAILVLAGCARATTRPDEPVEPVEPVERARDDAAATSGPFATSGDAAAEDARACAALNIGTLGGPGTNPSSNFQTWLSESGTSVAPVQAVATDPLTAASLARFDVVIINFLARNFTSGEAAVLESWVKGGGGVIAMSGFTSDPVVDWRANALLSPLGLAYTNPFIKRGPITSFVAHPLTQGITSVTFTGGFPLVDLGTGVAQRTAIGYLGPGEPVGFAVTLENGRAFVWGDEWIQFDSEWGKLPEIKRLWVQVFAWLAPDKCPIIPPVR